MVKKTLVNKVVSVCMAIAILSCPSCSFAHQIINYEIEQGNMLRVKGSLDNKAEGVLVNLWLLRDGKPVYIVQDETDEDGEYIITVNMENLTNGGAYTLKTVPQIENSASGEFEYYSETELETTVYTDLYNHKGDLAYITEALDGKYMDKLVFVNNQFKPLLDGEYASSVATFLSSELDKLETYSADDIVNALTYTAAIKSIEHASGAEYVADLFAAGNNVETLNKQKLLKLDTSKVLALFEKNADSDARGTSTAHELTEEQLKAKIERYTLFAENAAALGYSYSSGEDFVTKIEEALILTDIKRCLGNSSVLKMITDYSEQTGKIDLTSFNYSSNDKDSVIQDIALKFERNQITSLKELQENLDKNILIQNSTGGGGKKKGGSGGGGIAVVPKTDYNANELQKPDIVDFEDMKDYGWARESVEKLVELGMLNGISKSSFAPGLNVTRAQFAKMMCKVFGISQSNSKSSFDDVLADLWYSGYVSGLYNSGYITGVSEHNFEPDGNITRQDAFTIIYRILSDKGLCNNATSSASYDDWSDVSDYAKDAVSAVTTMQLVKGDGGKIMPKANMTRAEAAVIMHRIYMEVKQ